MNDCCIYPLGDEAAVIRLGSAIDERLLEEIRQAAAYLERHPFPGLQEVVPAYTTITVFYDSWTVYQNRRLQQQAEPEQPPYAYVEADLRRLLESRKGEHMETGTVSASRIVEIPVCYGEQYGEDLPEVAAFHGLSEAEVIRLHTAREYPVYMLGFAPGFAYLGGLDERIATPRKAVPRTRVPAGSVGIGGEQTGIYPLATPGGWQLIGRTPLALFRPQCEPVSLLQAGDRVRFTAISASVYEAATKGAGL